MTFAIDQGLPTLFYQHLRPTEDSAVTISRRMAIGKWIADAHIVAATSNAAEWYGLENPHDLLGKWLSLLQHPHDSRLGRTLALARHCGLPTPRTYVSRIRRSDNTFFAVNKEVTQATLGRETYLVTVLTAPEGPPLADEQGIWDRYHISPNQTEQFLGRMSIADIDETILEVHVEPQPLSPPVPIHPHYGLELGATVRLDDRYFAHRCARCASVWHSDDPTPRRCGKRGCQIGTWRNLKEPFHTMRLEGRTVTPEMVRTAWERRPRRRNLSQ